MERSQLDANTYGVGELITQRKVFVVPEHQRNYSWNPEDVEQFLSDVSSAMARDAADYFVGLVVLQGPLKNTWTILDGQQRLATTTMVYSAMREWLQTRGYSEDASQIEKEFIGVRQLGGQYSARLRLNTENREIFGRFVVDVAASIEIVAALKPLPKLSSNHKLLEAALVCRSWLESYCEKNGTEKEMQAQALFDLSSYLENRVKLICVDVSSETDAYILFESLNYRGVDLSALDLIKNYVFSYADDKNLDFLKANWQNIADNIEGRDVDDFLKVFWTSKFGKIQKIDLFNRLREKYHGEELVLSLVAELADASRKLNAIEDHEHPLWQEYGGVGRDRIMQLNRLGSRQARPVILAALSRFDHEQLNDLLRILVVLIVRFQLIGRGRTGVLEASLSRLAQGIWSNEIVDSEMVLRSLSDILPDDEIFKDQFARHYESNSSRLTYLLGKLDATFSGAKDDFREWRRIGEKASPTSVVPITEADEGEEVFYLRIGNYVLLEDALAVGLSLKEGLKGRLDRYRGSEILLTSHLAKLFVSWGRVEIIERSEFLADLAVSTWSIKD